MNAMTRPLAILAAAALGGAGLWLAGHWDMDTNGGYWAALGVVALAGMLIGLAQLRSPMADAPGMLALAWIPITIAAGWVLVYEQPAANTFRDHVRDWSASLGIADVVHYVTPFMMVLAFAIGLVFGLTMLAGWAMQRDTEVVEEERTAVTPVPTRMTAPPPMVAARPATETAPAEEEATAVGNGSRRREILLVP
jgi:hypothetical protein